MSLEQTIAELVKSNDAMAQSMEGQAGAINSALQEQEQRIDAKEKQVDSYLANARMESPFYRLTKNQFGKVTDNLLDHYSFNSQFTMSFEAHRTIVSGIDWEKRDIESQEILSSMGLTGAKYFEPSINIIKMTWNDFDESLTKAHTFKQKLLLTGFATVASYAKLVSGKIEDSGFLGITNDWGLCGTNLRGKPGSYTNSAPNIYTSSGEVLFAWYGIVAGAVPLDRTQPAWGFFSHLSASSALDTSV